MLAAFCLSLCLTLLLAMASSLAAHGRTLVFWGKNRARLALLWKEARPSLRHHCQHFPHKTPVLLLLCGTALGATWLVQGLMLADPTLASFLPVGALVSLLTVAFDGWVWSWLTWIDGEAPVLLESESARLDILETKKTLQAVLPGGATPVPGKRL